MSRTWTTAGSWGLVLALATTAPAGDDGPPPLTLPAEAPPPLDANPATRPKPAVAPSTTKPPATPKVSSSLLRPRANAATTPQPLIVKPALPLQDDGPPPLDVPPTSTDGPPPLDGPSEMRRLPERPLNAAGAVSRRRVDPTDLDTGDRPAQILEPIDSDRNLPPALTLEAQDHDGEILPKDAKPQAPPRRRFGILPAPYTARARANSAVKDPAIRVEPRSDPAADAALKRKLETKVKEAVGDKAREVEVRVVDRNIVVKAKVDRFWNKRPVRRTIETLPALAGYKARVEID
jgi:hypothetical protein